MLLGGSIKADDDVFSLPILYDQRSHVIFCIYSINIQDGEVTICLTDYGEFYVEVCAVQVVEEVLTGFMAHAAKSLLLSTYWNQQSGFQCCVLLPQHHLMGRRLE
jgi:hypothetical protein